MKAGVKVPIIIDETFGFGSRFELIEAKITPKTVHIGIARRRSGCAFAKATKELLSEMTEINKLADQLLERSRAFRKKLEASPKGDE